MRMLDHDQAPKAATPHKVMLGKYTLTRLNVSDTVLLTDYFIS